MDQPPWSPRVHVIRVTRDLGLPQQCSAFRNGRSRGTRGSSGAWQLNRHGCPGQLPILLRFVGRELMEKVGATVSRFGRPMISPTHAERQRQTDKGTRHRSTGYGSLMDF